MRRVQVHGAVVLVLALAAAAARVDAQTPNARPLLGSFAFPGDSGRVRTTSSGATQRAIVDTVTAMHARLEMHETTLQAGQAPHAAHRHVHEEMFVVLRGTLEVLLGETKKMAGPGSVVFCASNELHGIRNGGSEPASYIVMRLDTPASVAAAKAAAAASAKP
jgi:XRE family transcriptional regulator, regulator of sulfur utilization